MSSGLSEYFEAFLEVSQDGLSDDFFHRLPAAKGIVLFADSADTPIQLLDSPNIRRTVKLRLSADFGTAASGKADIKNITAGVYYTSCGCRFRTFFACYNAARRVFGDDYKNHISLPDMWYLKIDTSLRRPCFSPTKNPNGGGNVRLFGPFVTRKSASSFQNALEDAFGLCKRPELLGRRHDDGAASCPYSQMESCCRICAGEITIDDYLEKINKAFAAIKNPKAEQEKLEKKMAGFSENLEFEKAQRAKKQIESLLIMQRKDYKWITAIEQFAIVHIDKSAKIKLDGIRKKAQTYSVFLISEKGVSDFGDFLIEDLDNALGAALDTVSKSQIHLRICDNLKDVMNLAGFYLYRDNRPGVWGDVRRINRGAKNNSNSTP